MDNAKEQFPIRSIADGHFSVAAKAFTPIFANSQSAEYIKLHLLAQLVSRVVKVKLPIAFENGTGNHAIFIKSAWPANIKRRRFRYSQNLSRVFSGNIHESNPAHTFVVTKTREDANGLFAGSHMRGGLQCCIAGPCEITFRTVN